MESENKKKGIAYVEIIVVVVLAVLAIGSFAMEAYLFDAKTTSRDTALFNILQFLLTTGFAWFSTRAISRSEFEQSLKRFAIGAYRRITDIEAMVGRLREQLVDSRDVPSQQQLAVVGAVLEDAIRVIHSSTSDWADVIGDELIALTTIQNLRQQKTEIETEPRSDAAKAVEQRLREIDASIERLTTQLPADLQLESRRRDVDDRMLHHHVTWMRRLHEKEGGLQLQVVAGGEYKCDGDPESLGPDSRIFAVTNASLGMGVPVQDENGITLGRILNNSPLDYSGFHRTLADCYGLPLIRLEFLGELRSEVREDGKYWWYKVRVRTSPLAPTRTPRPRRDNPRPRPVTTVQPIPPAGKDSAPV